ncbi:MAG TPA: 50S ribosomal protein L11 [archaeon]|nr:50S ribosomal protein L11 [archaeon]
MAEVKALVEGGKATAAPPIGPALSPLKVNVAKVVEEINKKTKDFQGMQVPVTITVDEKTKAFQVSVGSPSTAALLKKEVGVEKGSGTPNVNKVGNITVEQAVKIARMKMANMESYKLKPSVKQVIGSCVSLGITVEGKKPIEVQKEIDKGKWDEAIKE